MTVKGKTMANKPINLDAIRRLDAELAKVLQEHPELRAPNPERQEALESLLRKLEEEDDDAETR
jgi:hypothetical protein